MKVSVALRPTATASIFDERVMMVPASVKEAEEFTKAREALQLKRVVRQRARPLIIRNTKRTAVSSTAGAQCKDICGTRAITAKTTKTLVAATTKSQSSTLRDGFSSPAGWRPSMRASTKSAGTL